MATDQQKEYANTLVGKYYVDEENPKNLTGKKTFTKKDIEDKVEVFRVLGPETMATRDWREERLNINVDSNDLCTSVHWG